MQEINYFKSQYQEEEMLLTGNIKESPIYVTPLPDHKGYFC